MIALRRLALPAIILLAALLALSQINGRLILASDNSIYVVLAQALARGDGYRMINEPHAPPMSLYPPGYPLLLAVALHLAGAVDNPMDGIGALKLVSALFYLGTLPLVYILVRRRHSPLLALLVSALTAASPSVLSLAGDVLSEMPFVFFGLLSLLLVEKYEETAQPLWLLGCGLALAGAYYMRTAALALLAALPLYLVIKRKVGAGLALGVLVGLLALPWLVRSSGPQPPETPFFARNYLSQVMAAAPYSDALATLPQLAGRLAGNSLDYAGDILPAVLLPHLDRLPLSALWAALLAVLVVLGFLLEMRRGLRASEVAVAAYWVSLSLFVWVLGFRYVILLAPFAFLYLLQGVGRLSRGLRRISHRLPATLVVALALGLTVSALAVDARRSERNLRLTRHQTLAQANAGDPEWAHYLQAVEWINGHTAPDAVVLGRKPELIYLLAGRQSVDYPYLPDSRLLLKVVEDNGVDYVVQDGFTWTRTTATYLTPAMQGAASSFAQAYETAPPTMRVWRVMR